MCVVRRSRSGAVVILDQWGRPYDPVKKGNQFVTPDWMLDRFVSEYNAAAIRVADVVNVRIPAIWVVEEGRLELAPVPEEIPGVEVVPGEKIGIRYKQLFDIDRARGAFRIDEVAPLAPSEPHGVKIEQA